MGKFPVIFISLKNVEGITFETALYRFVEIIGREAERFCFLEDSDKLTVNEKERYKALIRLDNGRYSMDTDILASSLKTLSEFLYKHYGKKTIIIIDEYDVPIIDMFLFLYDQYQQGYVTLDSSLDDKLNTLYDTLHDAQLQLQGTDYSRFVLNIDLPVEGDETYAALEEIRQIAAKYYGDDVVLVGNSTSNHDLESSFASDNIVISVLTALFVMIILFFTFQSAGLPVLLVLTIQGSIWVNFAVPSLTGQTVFFIAYLIVSAIQMGATIDYAIVISNRYLQLKKEYELKEAMIETLNQSFPTIFTSGSILTCAGFLIGEIASDATVASIGVALGRGTLISIILVLFVLPQILLMGDIIIEKTALAMNISRPSREIAGKVKVSGHVKGYVQGEIDADIQGVFDGHMNVLVDSVLPGRQGQIEDIKAADEVIGDDNEHLCKDGADDIDKGDEQ